MTTSLTHATAETIRSLCRSQQHRGPTAGVALGYVQANLVVLPSDWAYDFLLFCQRNPKPCPLLDVTDLGDHVPHHVAPNADLRTDLPAYRIWKYGEIVSEPHDLSEVWRSDLISFLIGCSFSFENALLAANIPVRHIEQAVNVPMYRTNIPCRSAGRFSGPMVVSMRPMLPRFVIKATSICTRFALAHGPPIHFGDPAVIGIRDLMHPDYGDPVEIRPGEVPVFWACGVTPQAALLAARPPFAITHKPGHMLVTDLRDSDLEN